MAPRGRPRDPAVDEAILAAARALLGEVGYARLTMEQVAARAGVGKASLYLRWSAKPALVADAIGTRPGLVAPLPDTGTLAGDMTAFLEGLVAPRDPGEGALAAVAGEAASNPELRRAFRRGIAQRIEERVRVLVERAVGRGELPASTDVSLLASLPHALLLRSRLTDETRPDDAWVRRIVAQFYTA